MEKVQRFLKIVRVHHFWFLTGLVLLIAGVTWFLTTSRLEKETKSRTETLNREFSDVSGISSTPLHPNDQTNEEMAKLNDEYKTRVLRAWKYQADLQQKILLWPRFLGRDFLQIVEGLKPIETKVPYPTEESQEPLNGNQRANYRNFIDQELPKLAEVVSAYWSPSAKPADREYLVEWSANNQQSLKMTRFSWPTNPTTLEVLYAQEDLWVLRALLNIIKNTNGDAAARYQAPVKEIDFLDIGPDAVGLAGSVSSAGAGGSGMMSGPGMGGGGMRMMSGPPGMAGGTMRSGPMGASGNSGGGDPAESRYVDKNFEPLTAERLRAAYDSRLPEDAFLAVAKRIPVRMRLKVDYRHINRLLAECGNNDLPVEVRQVRINMPSGSTFRGGGGGGGAPVGGGLASGPPGGMTMGGPPMVGGAPSMGGAPMMATGGGGGGGATAPMMGMMGGGKSMPGGGSYPMSGGGGGGTMPGGGGGGGDTSAWDVDVEIFGVVYLFNPVDVDKIGMKLDAVSDSATRPENAQSPPPDAAG